MIVIFILKPNLYCRSVDAAEVEIKELEMRVNYFS